MDMDKRNFLLTLIVSTILFSLIFSVLFPYFIQLLSGYGIISEMFIFDIISSFIVCLLCSFCISAVSFYLFVKDNRKCRSFSSALRWLFYYRSKVHMAVIPCVAFSVFFFLVFQSIGSVFLPLKSLLVSAILGIFISIILVTTFIFVIKKREKRILAEMDEIDRQMKRIMKDLEKFEKQE